MEVKLIQLDGDVGEIEQGLAPADLVKVIDRLKATQKEYHNIFGDKRPEQVKSEMERLEARVHGLDELLGVIGAVDAPYVPKAAREEVYRALRDAERKLVDACLGIGNRYAEKEIRRPDEIEKIIKSYLGRLDERFEGLVEAGDYGGAAECLEEVIRIKPEESDVGLYVTLSLMYLQVNQRGKAIDTIDRALETGFSGARDIANLLSLKADLTENLDDAIKTYNQALTFYEGTLVPRAYAPIVGIYVGMGKRLEQVGRLEESLDAFRKASDDPEYEKDVARLELKLRLVRPVVGAQAILEPKND